MNDFPDGIGDHARRMVEESDWKRRQRRKANTIRAIQRSATADEILARIVADLHQLDKPWREKDVDERNALVSSWRAKIKSEMEAYF